MENKEIMDILQTIVDNMATKDYLDEKIRESETRTKTYIDHNVTKKIDALFDGYKLGHEKQWELEQRVDTLERQMEEAVNK